MMKMMRAVEVWVVSKFIVLSSCWRIFSCASESRVLVKVAVRIVDNFWRGTYPQFFMVALRCFYL